MNKSTKLFTTIVVVLLLNACTGGGDNQTTQTTSTNAIITGTAVDELILNGKVIAKKPDGTRLATVRTSSTDGTYTLTIKDYLGAVIINVTCDANSTLKISDTQTKLCPSNLDLNSVSNIKSDTVPIKVMLSPLSEIVYQKALQLGNITSENIQEASTQITLIFGIDPILIDPTTGTYERIITAFHNAIDENHTDIFSVIDAFVADIEDNVVDNSPTLISAIRDVNVTNNLTEVREGESLVINPTPTEEVPAVDTPTPTEEVPAVDTPTPTEEVPVINTIQETKDMVQSLRTQGTTIEDFGNDELKKIETSVDNVRMDLESASDYIVGIIDMVSQARDSSQDSYSGNIEVTFNGHYTFMSVTVTKSTTNPNEWSYTTQNGIGTMTIPEMKEGDENTFTTLTASFSGTLPYVKNPDVIIQTVTLTKLTLTKTTTGANVLMSGLSIESSGTKISVDEVKGSVGYTKGVDGQGTTFDFVMLDSASLTASTIDYELKGKLTATNYVVNKSLEPRGGIEEEMTVEPHFNLYCYNSQLSLSEASLNLNGKNYQASSISTYYGSGYIGFDQISGDYSYDELKTNITTNASCSDENEPNIDLWYNSDSNGKIGNSGKIPSKVSFVGSLKNRKTLSEIKGTLNIELLNAIEANLTDIDTVLDNKNNYDYNNNYNNYNNYNNNEDSTQRLINNLDMKISLNGTLIMPNRPETLINLGYETKADDDAHRHTMTGSYSYDTTIITMSGSADKDINNGTLSFKNGTGIEATFIFVDGKLVNGNITNNSGSLIIKNGAIIASIEDIGNDMLRVKYLDGYFESIF